VILSGGELTVTRRGDGIGGPNAEYALALAEALDGAPGIHAIACDTDGVDGAAEVAGALIGPDTLAKARAAGLDAATRCPTTTRTASSPRSAGRSSPAPRSPMSTISGRS
jgi:glycerate-2-kinase